MNQVPVLDSISGKDFQRDFVDTGKPVVIRGMTQNWNALSGWSADYFQQIEGGVKLPVKTGNVAEGKRELVVLSEYVRLLEDYERRLANAEKPVKPPYLHDVPIFHLMPALKADIEPFPLELFPKWYWENWHNYIQFFMGSTGSLTPLHFDTLCTNNLFFQVVGRKKFILIPAEQRQFCYMNGWRWSKFDPSQPDYASFPLSAKVEILEVEIGPGDILFIPSGVLHQVHGLSYSVSFNIDWHTPQTARKGVMTLFEGAPLKNIYYNALLYLGLSLKVPPRFIFPYYKSYLNYVS